MKTVKTTTKTMTKVKRAVSMVRTRDRRGPRQHLPTASAGAPLSGGRQSPVRVPVRCPPHPRRRPSLPLPLPETASLKVDVTPTIEGAPRRPRWHCRLYRRLMKTSSSSQTCLCDRSRPPPPLLLPVRRQRPVGEHSLRRCAIPSHGAVGLWRERPFVPPL